MLDAEDIDLVEEKLWFEEGWALRLKGSVGLGPFGGKADALEAQPKVVVVVGAVGFVQPRRRVGVRCGEVEGGSLEGKRVVEGTVDLVQLVSSLA